MVLTRGGKTRNLHLLRSDTRTTQERVGSYSGAYPLLLGRSDRELGLVEIVVRTEGLASIDA